MLFRPFINIPVLSLRKRAKEPVQVFVVDTFSKVNTNLHGVVQSMDTLNRQFNKVYSGILFIDTYVNALHYVEQTVFEANNYIGEYHVLPGDHGIPLYITLSEAIIPVGSFYYLGKDNGLSMTNKLCHGRPLYQTACRDKKTVL